MTARLFYVAAAPFEAARRVAMLPVGHRCRGLHGHSFWTRVRAELPSGWAPFPGGETQALSAVLGTAITPLDYADLNTHLVVPTDENLARWVRARLGAPGIESVGIRSTSDQGVDLDAREHAHLWRRFRFESAHRLPRVPEGHPCGRMHGHGFEVILHADQDLAGLNPETDSGLDMGLDFDQLDALWAPLHAELDHACLNDIPGLDNPTSEHLSHWIWDRLKPQLPALSWVTVYETATAGCHFDGAHYRIWKERRFESALRLAKAPEGDPRRRLHGHSYLLRLHLTAPLDEVLGWTVDYGDVKALFQPVYRRLDHQRLDALEGLRDPDPGALTQWMRTALGDSLPALDRIDLHQTPGCGAVLCWGELGPALPT
jgi:6-pyruvoyltetrahydropterin/6-carboxytetrahydropterin synthase